MDRRDNVIHLVWKIKTAVIIATQFIFAVALRVWPETININRII